MKLKRIISTLLSAALLAGLLVFPASAAGSSGFTDISDPATAEAAEILRALGVVEGTGGGQFQPDRSLTRAEFCKLAIEVLGRGGEAASQSGRVIFSDVTASHWAIGYVNAAASKPSTDEPPLVAGVGNGLFLPDDPITYGGAVTILMRALGYSDLDVGMGLLWYDGYLNTAASIGLTEDVALSGDDSLSRGQAALLFRNLLFTKLKGSDTIYLSKLGGKVLEESALILSVDATASDGSTGAVKTTQGVYKTDRAPFPATYEGTKGRLVLDKNNKVLAIQAEETGSDRIIIASDIQATYVKSLEGDRLDIENPDTVKVYSAASDETPTYQDLWTDLRSGAQLTFHYSASGKLEYIYQRGSGTGASASASVVAKSFSAGSNPFLSLVQGVSSYRIYKNGAPATVSDIRKYDTATFDAASSTLQISDLKLTGVFQNVSPNKVTPTSVTIMNQEFPVLPGAVGDLAQFRLGDTVTFLLTADGKVAGAVAPTEAHSTIIGVVQSESNSSRVVVKAVNLQNYEFSGATTFSEESVDQLKGQLVTVNSLSGNYISVSRLTTRGSVSGDWDVQAGTIGSLSLAPNVKIFEQVGSSVLFEVDLKDVTCASVPASKLLYAGRDYAGRVNLLILNDVTGDHYTYGFLSTGSEPVDISNHEHHLSPSYCPTVTVKTVNNEETTLYSGNLDISYGAMGGIVASIRTLSSRYTLAGHVVLTSIKDVPRSAFMTQGDYISVTVNGSVYPVAENVICYNKVAGIWFDSLAEARAYSDSLTLYYDKAPEDGGKIRMIVAEK